MNSQKRASLRRQLHAFATLNSSLPTPNCTVNEFERDAIHAAADRGDDVLDAVGAQRQAFIGERLVSTVADDGDRGLAHKFAATPLWPPSSLLQQACSLVKYAFSGGKRSHTPVSLLWFPSVSTPFHVHRLQASGKFTHNLNLRDPLQPILNPPRSVVLTLIPDVIHNP